MNCLPDLRLLNSAKKTSFVELDLEAIAPQSGNDGSSKMCLEVAGKGFLNEFDYVLWQLLISPKKHPSHDVEVQHPVHLFVPLQRKNLEELRRITLPIAVVQAFPFRQPAALVTCARRLMILTIPSYHIGFTGKENSDNCSKRRTLLGVI